MTIVCPVGTASSVWIERVLIGGDSQACVVVPAMLTSAWTSSVTRPPALMCGVTCSNTPVSMYCAVVVTALVVPADDGLLADRNAVADLDRRLLVVERGEMRVGDHLDVAVLVEQVQRRLHAARETRHC